MKKIIVAISGGTVLLVGIAMILLPGPAIVVIPAGLAILATEFIWARRAMRRGKGAVARARKKSGILQRLLRRKPKVPVDPAK